MAIDDALRAETSNRLRKMAEIPVIPEGWVLAAVTTEFHNRLVATEHVDAGEAQLVVVALTCGRNNTLVTGDKRFVAAMAEKFPEEFERLKPSIVTFERCLLAVCESQGFVQVKSRLLAARRCDGTLHIALGSDGQADERSFKETLLRYSPVVSLTSQSCTAR